MAVGSMNEVKCDECGQVFLEGVFHKCPEFTVFMCGLSRCEHDYSQWVELDGGGTAVCSKCSARAIDEAMWG